MNALTPREAVADALYRGLAAFDLNDVDLLRSAFALDGVMTIRGKSHRGIDEIIASVFTHVSNLDTTHFATNVRIHFEDSKTAKLTALVLAQHIPPGEGTKDGHAHFLAGTRYDVDLIHDATSDLWKVKNLDLNLVWTDGDYSVMIPKK